MNSALKSLEDNDLLNFTPWIYRTYTGLPLKRGSKMLYLQGNKLEN